MAHRLLNYSIMLDSYSFLLSRTITLNFAHTIAKRASSFVLILIVALLLIATTVFASPIDDFPEIQKLEKIRIAITEAPSNGHQSAAATVVTRLRQFGYKGEIEVVYQLRVKSKLEFLMPPFNGKGSDTQVFPDLKLSFISDFDFNNLPQEQSYAPFAIMGADDEAHHPEDFDVKILLTLQPLTWFNTPTLRWLRPGQSEAADLLPDLGDLGYNFTPPEAKELPQLIDSQLSHSEELRGKIPGLLAIAQSLSEHDLAALYGHGIMNGKDQALIYLGGLARAMGDLPHLFKGGVIVPILNHQSESQREVFLELISQHSELKDRVVVKDIHDPKLPQFCAQLAKGKILVVQTGFVSKKVFEALYAASTVPPVVEGKNSINLMQLIGRPYLPSSRQEGYHFEPKSDVTLHGFDALVAPVRTRNVSESELSSHINHKMAQLAQFISASMTQGSAIQVEFANHRMPHDDLSQDQLYQGLIEVQKLMESIKAETTTSDARKTNSNHETCNTLLSL